MTLSQSRTAAIALRYAGKQKSLKADEFVAVVTTITDALGARLDRIDAKLLRVEQAMWRQRGNAKQRKRHGS